MIISYKSMINTPYVANKITKNSQLQSNIFQIQQWSLKRKAI